MDRFLTLVRPEPRGASAAKRAKILAWTARILAAAISVPEVGCPALRLMTASTGGVAFKQKLVVHIQAIVYHVEIHPFKTWVKQCTPAGALESAEAEVAYALCRLLAFPFLPFTLTLFYYLRIWQKLSTMAVAG